MIPAPRWRRGPLGVWLAAGLVGCAPEPSRCVAPPPWAALPEATPTPAVAHVGSLAIGVGRLGARRARGLPAAVGEVPLGARAALDEEVRFARLVLAAEERGLAGDPEVVEATQRAMVERLLARELEDAGGPAEGEAQERAIAEAYRAQAHRWVRAPLRQVEVALVRPSPALGEQLAALWRGAPAPLPADYLRRWRRRLGWRAPARPAAGSLVGEARLGELVGVAAARAAFAAEVPSLVGRPEACADGPCVLQVLAEQPGQARPLSEVREQIRDQLRREARAAAFGRLLAQLEGTYPARVDAARLAELQQLWGESP